MSFISPLATDASGKPKQTGSMQTLGRDDFLQLLVTKLQHQDPLKPMDDENFIAQLAQFSSLEQMNNIAEGIKTSNQWDFLQMQSLNNVMAVGLIGREVKAEFTGVYVDSESTPTISFTTDKFAETIDFTITDEEGNVVVTITSDNVEPGVGSIVWDGRDTQGNTVPEGFYNVKATARNGDITFEPSLSLVGIVDMITYRDGAAFLRVNGTEIGMGDISAISESGSS